MTTLDIKSIENIKEVCDFYLAELKKGSENDELDVDALIKLLEVTANLTTINASVLADHEIPINLDKIVPLSNVI
jgi:hypothetical protein